MIVILDYGMGNVGSILNMLKKLGHKSVISSDPNIIKEAGKLILPGVGSFDTGVEKLTKSGLIPLILNHAKVEKKPLLGICLGMQLLGEKSEEGKLAGLSLIPFESKKFNFEDKHNLKTPHMGWNLVRKVNESYLVNSIDSDFRFYFVHSFHAVCKSNENILLESIYGYKFASAVFLENILGVQFHPEKSHKFGMKILDNFARRDNFVS
ncbi:glutamine amidotransferase [Planococcus glaciei]|uniref:imidazole glycerol phosphate synthase subunit HisH n=1 Tax=Planococcus glaciei TaxID=459472 RepID=UPI000886F224|nr:imidazole glycerol phosphate synthase subunit HisH [Planococcus glaciei]SDH87252.1 glutamine amidotransferase [Planococcus glaciei]